MMGSCSKDEVLPPPMPPVGPTIINAPNTFLYQFDAHSNTADSLFYLSFDLDSSLYHLAVSNYTKGSGYVTIYDIDWGVMRIDTLTRNQLVSVSDFQGTLPGAISLSLTDFTGKLSVVDSARAIPKQMTLSEYPNRVGTEWIYLVHDNLLVQPDTLFLRISGTAILPDGRLVTLRELVYRNRTDTEYVYAANDTVQTDFFTHPSFYQSMTYLFPLKIGRAWGSEHLDSQNRVVQNYGITVPMGEFGNGFRIEKFWHQFNDWYRITTWFVPGIGIVKRTRNDYAYHIVSWELISFHAPPNQRLKLTVGALAKY
jgi:hypothetical protein